MKHSGYTSGSKRVATVLALTITASVVSSAVGAADAPEANSGTVQAAGSSMTREALDQAIEKEKENRSAAIAGMVVGGVVILGGSLVSAVASAQNASDRDNGQPGNRNTTTGTLVGMGVGLPIVGISAYFFTQSMHQLHQLQRQRLTLSYSQETGQPVVGLAFDF